MSITLLTVFLAEALLCAVSGEQLNRKVGEDLVLKPDKSTVPDSITNILWKHGNNKVAELDKAFSSNVDFYATFKHRTTLDQTTGELRISRLMKTDSGVYSVEFNGKPLDKTYKLSVINKTSCTLTCEGDTTDAEPVTYSWKVGEGLWEVGDKQLIVSKSNTGKSTCKMKNSAGEGEVSEPVELVFGSDAWLTKARLFGFSVFVLAVAGVLLLIFVHRAKTGVFFYEKESMPWKGEFWKKQREVGPTTDSSNRVSASPGVSDSVVNTPAAEERGEKEEEALVRKSDSVF